MAAFGLSLPVENLYKLIHLKWDRQTHKTALAYDIFISYSRRDNAQGRIKELVERIKKDFAEFAGRPLVPFFDKTEIQGKDDWRHRILH
jgi:hypothetical protein